MQDNDTEKKNSVISLKDVTYSYPDSDRPAVDHVSLDIRQGEFVALLGRNGSGKSTLGRLMNALLLPSSGEVTVNGITPKGDEDSYLVRRECGMVFQNPDNQIVATVVEEDCAFGPENLGVEPQEIRRRVDTALSLVGMSEYAKSAPHMLSGGQKQRIAIAGVLAMKPGIIVFDESTAMLDPVGRRDIFSIARSLNRDEGITIVWITHFMNEAAFADRVAVMDRGTIALSGTPREVFSRVEDITRLGLDCPEMTRLALRLREKGLDIPADILTVEEMEVALCR